MQKEESFQSYFKYLLNNKNGQTNSTKYTAGFNIEVPYHIKQFPTRKANGYKFCNVDIDVN